MGDLGIQILKPVTQHVDMNLEIEFASFTFGKQKGMKMLAFNAQELASYGMPSNSSSSKSSIWKATFETRASRMRV